MSTCRCHFAFSPHWRSPTQPILLQNLTARVKQSRPRYRLCPFSFLQTLYRINDRYSTVLRRQGDDDLTSIYPSLPHYRCTRGLVRHTSLVDLSLAATLSSPFNCPSCYCLQLLLSASSLAGLDLPPVIAEIQALLASFLEADHRTTSNSSVLSVVGCCNHGSHNRSSHCITVPTLWPP